MSFSIVGFDSPLARLKLIFILRNIIILTGFYLSFFFFLILQHEKKRQLETQRVHTFQLMLEKEQSYVDKLRSELAKAGTGSGGGSNVTTLQNELAGAERRVRTLQEQLAAITTNEQVGNIIYFALLRARFATTR